MKGLELDAQHILGSAVVVAVHAVLGVVAARGTLRRQVLCLGVFLLDDLSNLLVGEVASSNEESLVASGFDFDGLDVAESEVADINPQEGTGLRDLLLGLALVDVSDALVAGVQRVERVQVVDDRTEDKRRVHGRDGEVRLLLLKEVP